MTQIAQIIQSVLEETGVADYESAEQVAKECEKQLLLAIGQQYRSLAEKAGITPFQLLHPHYKSEQ